MQNATTDSKLSSATPTTSFRTSDLQLIGGFFPDRPIVQFTIPLDIDISSIVSATVLLTTKTLTGSDNLPIIVCSLVSGTPSYTTMTWNIYNSGLNWTSPGGDVIPNTSTASSGVNHTGTGILIGIGCKEALIYALTWGISTINLLIQTDSEEANITYYSRETTAYAPKIEIVYRASQTPDRSGRVTSILSVPSI